MDSFLSEIIKKAKADKKTIVLAEGNEERTLVAAEKILQDEIANLIIIGNEKDMGASGYDLKGARIIDPNTYEDSENLACQLAEIRKSKGMTQDEARKLMRDELYLGVMLVKTGVADGMVAGATHATSDVLRPALQILKTAPGSALVSSCFVMIVPDCSYGKNGRFIFADCGLEVQPTAEKLAAIALDSANTFETLLEGEAQVALLSHSSLGSSNGNDDALKVETATKLAREKAPNRKIDGELQLDAAIVPEIAQLKAPQSPVAGRANVLVFPDLDAGNIGYKLVERLAKAQAYGPITQGIAAPVNDLSRGCKPQDIYGVVAITAVQAGEKHA